ncbi:MULTISPECIES: MBL fold metallo-hydrolase [unclassified Streptomyces]|uniref:MBL fold metallo-hydrolase n=1 Tax=Streptomyces sp. R33 TaxID=3238629 RepID=A0AB39YEG7_9ACTN|nr:MULTISPECIES: MBL fold metallo-hydrolase [unclassified Streptomyces]THA41687.1 MBL fold metallo-hydrolase [Streptomyces sp. A1547]
MPAHQKRYLRPSVVPQPLLHRWYAWPYLLAPHTGALNLRDRLLPIVDSYLKAPHLHDAVIADPHRYGAPFLDPDGATLDEVRAARETMVKEGQAKLQLADDIAELRALLREKALGGPMEPLYPLVPASLRGRVELVYDTAHRPTFRFFEALMYGSPAYERHGQCVSLTAAAPSAQPFVYSSPVLPRADRLDIDLPFDSPVWDELFAARLDPVDVPQLAQRLGVCDADLPAFTELFHDTPPPQHTPPAPGDVRVRYFNHATVLIETGTTSVLLDPLIGYTGDGHEHYTLEDLPRHIDAVVISHFHSDHFSLETLLQLRTRIGTIVVPRASGGSLPDPSLKSMLQALGFTNVQELAELETHRVADQVDVTALPFVGEHADLDIRTKMVPLVRAGGRRFLFATDITPLEPALFDNIPGLTSTPLDALFIGLECVGAPLKWLYGPMLEGKLSREHNNGRRLKGSNAAQADELAQQLGARHVYAYAMGLEPWLKHLTGSEFDPEAEQVQQAGVLTRLSAERGITAELLRDRAERIWPAVDPAKP